MKIANAPKWILGLSLLSMVFLSVDAFSQDEIAINHFNIKINKPHDITLLNNGLASLEERLQMIERATKTIDVEYFIYRTDKSAKIFTQALIKKAREGVKVRMLLDYFMIKSDLSPYYAHELEQEGIEVKYFNTTSTFNLFSGQYRNHRKVLLVDGHEKNGEALTGGRNIGDEYFDLHEGYNFLDRDISLKGEIVSSIQKTFDETFNTKKSVRMKRGRMPEKNDMKYRQGKGGADAFQYQRDIKYWNQKVDLAVKFAHAPLEETVLSEIRAKGQEELAAEYKGSCPEMSFMSEYPTIGRANRKKHRLLKHDIFKRIENANESIMIDSPYFIVNNELGQALDKAFANNINIRLLTNSLNSTDAIYVYAAFDSIALEWLNKGLDSFIYKGAKPASYNVLEKHSGKARFGVHAKTFIFDHEDVIIGTYNVDPRSANFNSEMYVSCENNSELAAIVQKDIDTRLEGSIHLDSAKAIDDAEFFQVGFGKRLTYYFLKGPSNAFSYLL